MRTSLTSPLVWLVAALFLVSPGPLFGVNRLALVGPVVPTDGSTGFPFSTPVLLTNDFVVRAYTLAIRSPQPLVEAIGFDTSASLTDSIGAESIIVTPDSGGLVVQVVLDSEAPFDGQTIPVGTSQLLGAVEWQTTAPITEPLSVPLQFTDGTLGSPAVFNHLVGTGGLPYGAGLGLVLVNSTSFLLPGQAQLSIPDGSIPPFETITVPILFDNTAGPLDAFVVAVAHGSGLELLGITLADTDTITVGPEFVSSDLQTSGGLITVIFDFEAPLDGLALAPGLGQVLARYTYACANTPVYPAPPTTHTLEFVDGLLGFPPADNTITIDGLAVPAPTSPGTIVCEAFIPPNASFYGGQLVDDTVVPVEASAGTSLEYRLYYTEPNDLLEALQIALEIDPQLELLAVDFDITGSTAEMVGAEYVAAFSEPAPSGGTYFACDLYVDVLPPFAGQTLPPTDTPLLLGHLSLRVDESAPFGELLPVTFVDWTSSEPIDYTNVVLTVDDESQPVANLVDGAVEVALPIAFLRGDCNNDSIPDIADAITLLGILFFDAAPPTCPHACDHNADTVLDIADYIYLVQYLFLDGNPPPPPFPTCSPIEGFICAEAACP